jgi:hypothetical protein
MPHHMPLGGRASRPPFDLDIFHRLNALLLTNMHGFSARYVAGGYMRNGEYIVPNPDSDHESVGALRLSLRTGRWIYFTTGHRGGDPISYFAHTFGQSQIATARILAAELGAD